jgi:hypothetical protein
MNKLLGECKGKLLMLKECRGLVLMGKVEKCPFHPFNNGTCDLALKAPLYCKKWCHVRERLKQTKK